MVDWKGDDRGVRLLSYLHDIPMRIIKKYCDTTLVPLVLKESSMPGVHDKTSVFDAVTLRVEGVPS